MEHIRESGNAFFFLSKNKNKTAFLHSNIKDSSKTLLYKDFVNSK